MSGTIAIRRARGVEAAVLTDVAHAAKRFWGYSDDLLRLWERDLTVSPDYVRTHEVHCAVDGAADGAIVGFYAVAPLPASRVGARGRSAGCAESSPDGVAFELEHMWVLPARMRSGIGAALLRHALEVVRSANGNRLEIAADPNAEAFYVRRGARRVGTVSSAPAGRTLPLLSIDVDRAAAG